MLTALAILLACFYGIVPAVLNFGPLLLIPTAIDLVIGAVILLTWLRSMGGYKLSWKERVTYVGLFSLSWGLYLKLLLTPLPQPLYLQKQPCFY